MPKRSRARKQTISIDGSYRVTCCEDGHIHVWLWRSDTKPFELIADPEEAYEFAQAILRGYDFAVGIGPATD